MSEYEYGQTKGLGQIVRLSKRLETVASFVTPGSRIADVGTDHGYIPIALTQRGTVFGAIAMDVREGPLGRAREHIRQYGLKDRVETRLSDGVEQLREGEADTVVIAGMGGELVIHILEQGRRLWKSVKHWVLSPQSELDKVRGYLWRQGFDLVREAMVEEDGKYYTVMEAVWQSWVEEPDRAVRPETTDETVGLKEADGTVGLEETGPAAKAGESDNAAKTEKSDRAQNPEQPNGDIPEKPAERRRDGQKSQSEQRKRRELTEAEYLYGPRLIEEKDPVLTEFLMREERQLAEIVKGLEGRAGAGATARKQELEIRLEVVRETLREIRGEEERRMKFEMQ